MRAENKLDNVDVHNRAIKASERVSTNGIRLQDALHLPHPTPESWFSKTFKWENLTVAGREVKGFVIPQWAAIVLLGAIISAVGVMYNQNQNQREMLIRLDQKLTDKNDHDTEFRQEMKSKFESVMAWQEVTNKNLVRLEEQNRKKGG